jgi:hypothetical protein
MYIDNETTTLTPQDGNSWAILSGLTNSTQATSISQHLSDRWGPYGAPAIEAADAVSPFISGFEIQAHFLASNTTAALSLMRNMWGFMLDDPRMTNSTFIEGYSSTGELHYAPYLNDARISHAHGWATGPTSSLTFYVAGIQILSAGGQTWRIAPNVGDLKTVEAGFSTSVGWFESKVEVTDGGMSMEFETPVGTMGEVVVPVVCEGNVTLHSVDGRFGDAVVLVKDEGVWDVAMDGVGGGKWAVSVMCS